MKTIGNKEECCQAGGAGNKEDQRLTSVLTSIDGIVHCANFFRLVERLTMTRRLE